MQKYQIGQIWRFNLVSKISALRSVRILAITFSPDVGLTWFQNKNRCYFDDLPTCSLEEELNQSSWWSKWRNTVTKPNALTAVSALRSVRILVITFSWNIQMRWFKFQNVKDSQLYLCSVQRKSKFQHLDGQKCLQSWLMCADCHFHHKMSPCTMQPHDARILLEDLTTIDLKTASFHMYHATWEFT